MRVVIAEDHVLLRAALEIRRTVPRTAIVILSQSSCTALVSPRPRWTDFIGSDSRQWC